MHNIEKLAQNDANEQNQQLTAGLGTAGLLLGGIGFLYGAGTATERHGLAPWVLLAAYLAVTVGFAVAVHLVNRSRAAAPTSRTRAGQIFDAVVARLDWGGPVPTIVLAVAVPWISFASYGLILLAQG
ncbi:hypothetical protein ABH935_007001 [Catenulispora sp. GAS73]|uniref:hypothetical protein n=1 Tax=Catenulispora sp. GAS73 TaxID=3156269 RepID=UPI00351550A3